MKNRSKYAKLARHRTSTSSRWHSRWALCCHSNETRAVHRLQIRPIVQWNPTFR